jgi:3-methylcrotonyl-CoA carboxylase beta subunit
MAADTAETVLTDIRLGGMKGKETTEAEIAEIRSSIRAQYEEQSDPYYATSRLWDDGLISPLDTRHALGLSLALAARQDAPPAADRIVYRM